MVFKSITCHIVLGSEDSIIVHCDLLKAWFDELCYKKRTFLLLGGNGPRPK